MKDNERKRRVVEMEKEIIEEFLGKVCLISLSNNGFRYTGSIVRLSDVSMVFKDRFCGKVVINLDNISTLSEVEKVNGGSR